MNYRKLGSTGLKVSEISLGALEIGRNWGIPVPNDFGRPEEKESIYLLEKALDLGINFIDTAPAYQLSEEIIGKGLNKQGKREHYYLATKVGEYFDENGSVYDYSYEGTLAFIDRSLQKLCTDYIDLIQIHSAQVDIIEKRETLEALQKARQDGKVRFIGVSVEDEQAAWSALHSGDYDTIQTDYHLLNRWPEEGFFQQAKEANIGIIIKNALYRGRLTDKSKHLTSAEQEELNTLKTIEAMKEELSYSLPQVALKYVLREEAVSTIIVGTRKVDHLQENIKTSKLPSLPSEIIRAIQAMESTR